MNRTEHLIQSARCAAEVGHHDEHIILDYGSAVPVSRGQLPNDNRIKLFRCEVPSGEWWLTHAYNLAFALAEGEYILKLDADIMLSKNFADQALEAIRNTPSDLMCSRLTLQDWSLPADSFNTNGVFLCRRPALVDVGGFNPYIQGWGWDEIDLYSRFFLRGHSIKRLPLGGVTAISHGNDLRVDKISKPSYRAFYVKRGQLELVGVPRRLQVQNEKNRQIAIASIIQGACWPALSKYRDAYRLTSQLPPLERRALFRGADKAALMVDLVNRLIRPSRIQRSFWRFLGAIGVGPYTSKGAQDLLAAYNISLSLVV